MFRRLGRTSSIPLVLCMLSSVLMGVGLGFRGQAVPFRVKDLRSRDKRLGSRVWRLGFGYCRRV